MPQFGLCEMTNSHNHCKGIGCSGLALAIYRVASRILFRYAVVT